MDIIYSLLIGILKLISYIAHPLFVYRAKGKKVRIPPIKNDLLKISATELAKKIRIKQISSIEVCKAYIDRVKEVNPILNAVVQDRFQQAMQDAKKVDDYINKSSLTEEELKKIKPLLGVPMTVKESCSLQDMSLSVGTLSRKGYKADNDSELVARLRAAGAIPLLVSNTPELCLSWESTNFITGTTKNPYDTTCTSGGSSGGEAALLGSGASLIGLGSDVAGSIRIPAMNNCIFGHKPTSKIAPIKGHYPYIHDEKFKEFLVMGPMTRYAKDLKLMMKVLTGGKIFNELGFNEKVDISQLKVYFMEEAGKSLSVPTVEDEIKQAVTKAANYLNKNCSSILVDKKFPHFKYANQVCGKALFTIKDIPNPLKGDNAILEVEILKCLFGQSQYTGNILFFFLLQKLYEGIVGDHCEEFNVWKKELQEALGNNGIFLYPTCTTSATKHNELIFSASSVMYCLIASSMGFPSTNVPCGLDKNGMPIGIQVIAAPHQDRLCLAVAEELEKCFGGWLPPN